MTSSSSVIGEFSFQGKQPKKLELKEKIFNDFFKAFVVVPKAIVTDSKQSSLDKKSSEAEYANLKDVYNKSRTNFQSTMKMTDRDNFYLQKESDFWSKNLEKSQPNSSTLQELSKNVS